MRQLTYTLILALAFTFSGIAQNNLYKYARWDSMEVMRYGANIETPWGGGMNQPQFSEIDLNFDGIKDLFVFDRAGNTVRTFINNGTANQVSYTHAPQFQKFFPQRLDQFALLRDFNCDGKEDIFTYTPGGFRVYRNISDSVLKFQLETKYLPAIVFGNVSGVYVVNVDIPNIEDIDGDGDLDILTFSIFGTLVDFYENITTDCDTMIFERHNSCWGHFFENQLTDSIVLGAACKGGGGSNGNGQAARHTGATMLTLDLDNDTVADLLMGDVDYTNLVELTNGGTKTDANMTAVEYQFPDYDTPVNLETFPAAYYLDLDNNGVKDLLVAPNDTYKGADLNNVWYYKNFGGTNIPNFSLQETGLFVDDQIDHGTMAYPVLADISGDGLEDLLVGNMGYFQDYDYINFVTNYVSQKDYYKNIGTATAPKYEFVTDDLAGLSSLNLVNIYPSFNDMDADGDNDMLFGEVNGKIYYYENTAGPGNPANFVQVSNDYFNINVGTHPLPTIHDVDGDGLNDLLIGERNGHIHLYLNEGSATSAAFSTAFSDSLGGINMYSPGYPGFPSPFVGKVNGSNENILMVANAYGDLLFYSGLDTNLGGTYTVIDSLHLDQGRLSVAGANLTDNDSLELVIGQIAGGLFMMKLDSDLYNANPWDSVPPTDTNNSVREITLIDNVEVYPNPAKDEVHINFKALLSSEIQYAVYDLSGKQLINLTSFVTSGNNQFTLNTGHLSSGIYLMQIKANQQRIPIKLVIQ